MPREFGRSERVADAVQRELADLIRQEIRDPRLALVNITDVEVSRDLAVAKVYVNFIKPIADPVQADSDINTRVAVLNKAGGFLRSQLARRVHLRVTPRLTFVYDNTGDKGQHLAALIERAVARDQTSSTNREEG